MVGLPQLNGAKPLDSAGADDAPDGDHQVLLVDLFLDHTIQNMDTCLACLDGTLKNAVGEVLHNPDTLPNQSSVERAAKLVELLHQVQLRLDQRTVILADHFLGYTRSKCLLAAVQQNIPAALAHGPLTLDDLARATDSRPDRLKQIMRALYNEGVFAYDSRTGLYSNNSASILLLPDHWSQWHNWVTLYTSQFYDMARGIPDSIGKDAVRCPAQINFDTPLGMFDYFKEQGWVPQLHRTLGGGAIAMAPGIVTDYPWSEVADQTIMDIGGGGGALLASLLRAHPRLHGGIYERAEVIQHARQFFRADGMYADVGDRVAEEHIIQGDFFKSVPSFGVYVMKWCLHDWGESDAVVILRNIRRAIKQGPGSRLIVLESVLADGHAERLTRYGDLNMMMTVGGQERQAEDWTRLAAQSGWRIEKVWNLRNAWVKALDFRPAEPVSIAGAHPGHLASELRRLRMQHDWIKASMGSLVHAPINPLKKDLKILDSATADGYWIEDVSSLFPDSTTYIGTDIDPARLPAKCRSNITFQVQSVKDPWPLECMGTFDLVHQRLVLNTLDTKTAQSAVESLFKLVKPGGWIQLLEVDHSAFLASQEHETKQASALAEFSSLFLKLQSSFSGEQPARLLREWLLGVGAVDVIQTLLDCPIGKKSSEDRLRKDTVEIALMAVRRMSENEQAYEQWNLDQQYFDDLQNRLEKELDTVGGWMRFHLVYGRKKRV